MEEMEIWRLRELLLDIYTVDEAKLEFNTDRGLSKGYSIKELEFADKVLELNPLVTFHTFRLKDDIRYLLSDEKFNPIVFYIELAELIFIIDLKDEVYSYMYGEDLEEQVAELKAFEIHLDDLMTNTNNDAYGEPL